MKTPILETDRLILRPFKEEDAIDVFECWEIGYNLGKKYWGIGYTTEAMKKVIDLSGNVMNKLGFKREKDIPYECNNGTIKREGIQCRLIIDN